MRYEITLRNLEHAPALAGQLRSRHITQINLTDKTGMPNNLEAAQLLHQDYPELDIIPHYSFKNHTSKNPDIILHNFTNFLQTSQDIGINQVLLLSGHPKPKFDVLKSIDFISNLEQKPDLKLACAFNPFLNDQNLEDEQTRLHHKFQSGLFSSVYLQIGLHLSKLQTGIDLIKGLDSKIKIYGCVLIPSLKTLSNLKLRPWHGVDLSPEYLENLTVAEQMTKQIHSLYKQNGIEPLIGLSGLTDNNFSSLDKIIHDT
jgi:hypothetical protein